MWFEYFHPTYFLKDGWPHIALMETFFQPLPATTDVPADKACGRGGPETWTIHDLVQFSSLHDAAVTLGYLDLPIANDTLRGFLFELTFAPDPLDVSNESITRLLREIRGETPEELLQSLPFAYPGPPVWPSSGRWNRARHAACRRLVKTPGSTPEEEWAREVFILIWHQIVHGRLIRIRSEFLKLKSQWFAPSTALYREHLDSVLREDTFLPKKSRTRSAAFTLGRAAARCSNWWLDKLEWDLRRADNRLKPRGSYMSQTRAPKQLFVWHETDYFLREALRRLPTNLDRSRAIAATLAVFAGPSLYFPGSLEQFATNIVERWRTRKSHLSSTFSDKPRGLMFLQYTLPNDLDLPPDSPAKYLKPKSK